MHGIIFDQLHKFITEHHGEEKLNEIKKEAGLSNKLYLAMRAYPDSEIQAIINSASKILNVPKETLLEAFGKYITPGLMHMYGPLIDQQWDILDVLEHIESTIHRVVRNSNPGATPPKLVITRAGTHTVHIDYTSERKMVSLGVGIIKSMAEHYNEQLTITKNAIPNGTRLEVVRKTA